MLNFFGLLTEEILDQLESNISKLELDITHPLDHSDMEEALENPLPMEIEGIEEQEQQEKEKKKGDSTFIQDIGLGKEQEMELDLNCSFQDPDYQELEESFISGKGEGCEEKEGECG